MTKVITTATPQHCPMLNDLLKDFKKYHDSDIDVYYANDQFEGEYGTHPFFNVTLKKILFIIKQFYPMDENNSLIFLDADIHLRGNIIDAMNNALQHSGKDILFQKDEENIACTGMFICKTSKKVKDFFMDVYSTMLSRSDHYMSHGSDQTAANDILAKQKIDYDFLDERFTTFGVLRNDQDLLWSPDVAPFKLPRNVLAFHANYTIGVENKMKLLAYARTAKTKRTYSKKSNLSPAK
jgi:hypothetical protein